MSKENKLTCFEAEVLSSDISKYSSTSVSGGGGSAASTGSYIHVQVNPVTTHVTHHSDQDMWVRDTKTNQEINFNFSHFNIAVRPGHKLILLLDETTDNKFERVVNLTTGTRATCNGSFNEYTTNRIIPEMIGLVVLMLFSAIPYANVLIMITILLSLATGKSTVFTNDLAEKNFINKLMDCVFLILPSIAVYFSILHSSYIPSIFASTACFIYIFKDRIANKFSMQNRNELIESTLNDFMTSRGYNF